jgi:glyoxylase-like metal-dependent hydrolase (beta-lactamase superfamily II)
MTLKVHHLACGTMCPFGGRLVGGEGGLLSTGHMVCHCLLIETPSSGLVLVDSGFGTREVRDPKGALGRMFLALTRPQLALADTAVEQVKRLGFAPSDVRHILVTHLDLDHAGGLPDFPHARVHVHAAEHHAAMNPTLRESQRYKAHQWAHHPAWALYPAAAGEPWFGFPCVRDLEGLPPEILLVPLPGHTRGHSVIAVQTAKQWLLHAGDAYFFRSEVHANEPPCPPVLRAFQSVVEVDHALRVGNQARLRQLDRDHGREVAIFSAHDPVELQRLAYPAG